MEDPMQCSNQKIFFKLLQKPLLLINIYYVSTELYLHNESIPENKQLNLNPLVGDIQIRALASFLANQITWQNAFLATRHNEDNRLL
jgi:hypothetical protein